VKAEASGYASQTLSATVQPGVRSELNFALLRERIRLERVFFSPGSAALLPASYPALDDAVRVLKSRPTLRVEIQGHTDSVSSELFNIRLSQRRAEAVRNYLVMQGVEPGRLMARGYGESMPVGDNRTRAGRQLNRRIEFLILGE
jgi:outer membrane protein OmpA-like peptidoglycan-associated protein